MRTLALTLALTPLVAVPPAEAAPFQLAIVDNVYVLPEVQVVEGHTLEVTNLDVEGHDVYSLDVDLAGRPLFSSGVVGTGGHALVAGVESLPPSVYPFVCSFHSEMFGNITVHPAS